MRKMYKGIGPESGKRVHKEDALPYAVERIATDDEIQGLFVEQYLPEFGITINKEDFKEIVSCIEEWFYSGNWQERAYDGE